jgi:hypothetical protein
MALAKNMMGGGLPGGTADAINGSVATGLTATGTTQGTALALGADINFLGTVASSTGAILYAGQSGDSQIVYNGGANALTVYPPSGAKINNASTNAGVSLATNTFCQYHCVSSTQWIANLSA